MKNLRKIRILNGYSQREFATIMGVPPNTYNQWETGKRQPDYEMLSRIADFYDVTVDYLLGREQKEKPAEVGKIQAAYDQAPEEIKTAVRKLLDI